MLVHTLSHLDKQWAIGAVHQLRPTQSLFAANAVYLGVQQGYRRGGSVLRTNSCQLEYLSWVTIYT